ncbi:ABC transporter ATP-binding protein [Tengunoibacter tsumagoiensis]|uniref:ABC transporter ATP-binding protein n=1 Tax=Tengunoibacter tsumagoiensis TaxID=2014871 RepID=A0A402AAU4_9CHLR|nr:energy-coupling factor transporter ATPase [Tengunoibacter tsumagoiensis]GCE16061.1 ABC transporter ATP-binding protein [Tengunoibacter tsumagoiensis]
MVTTESFDESYMSSPAPQSKKVAALEVSGLWWRYPTFNEQPSTWTLRDLSLRVEQGECFGITGPSGAGKTTLCRTLMGILPFTARLNAEQQPHHFRGHLSLLGQPITATTSSTHQMGMVLQDPENQFLRMSLLHELGMGLQIQGVPNDEILRRSFEALKWVGLEHLWHGAAYLHPSDLSGGQKQRVAIAAFLALRPEVLILDEPTSDLDPVGKREVIETIARLRQDYRMTVVLVEQDPDILATFCDRIAVLNKGRIELVATPRQFYANRSILEPAGVTVGELVQISWQTGHLYESRPPLTLEEGIETFAPIVAQQTFASQTVIQPKQDQPVVEAVGVTYHYGDGTTALKGIDLTLNKGEMLALLGPNGSGKTTFAKILAGIYRASQGKIQVLGQDLASRKVRSHLARSVGYVFQNPDHQLFCRKVSDEIEYGLKNLRIDPKRRREIVATTLEAVQLSSYASEDPLFLSKGQRQRLAVAAVLAMGPDILIVDEPTTGQDRRSILGIMQLLGELQQQGKTILIITHDMTLVAEYCQRVVAFRSGQLSFTGTPTELFAQPETLAQTGLSAPSAAALSASLRPVYPHLPPLLTAQQWSDALKHA